MEKHKEIEQNLITKYRKKIYRPFVKALNDYEMIRENDKIAICISGGKDSMLLAKCMQEIQKYTITPFTLEFVVMDPGYDKVNRERIIENAKLLEIPIKIFEANIFGYVETLKKNPCYLCARMRRGHLYRYAQGLGCNKIALGHHFNDMIETTLMSMLYGAEIKTMMPKLKSTNVENMELIRPLYLVKEEDIIKWKNHHELKFIECACSLTRRCESEKTSKRKEIKLLISDLKKINPNVDINIFNSVHNVNLATIIGYREREGAQIHHFSDDYD